MAGYCGNCGTALMNAWKFCRVCGTSLMQTVDLRELSIPSASARSIASSRDERSTPAAPTEPPTAVTLTGAELPTSKRQEGEEEGLAQADPDFAATPTLVSSESFITLHEGGGDLVGPGQVEASGGVSSRWRVATLVVTPILLTCSILFAILFFDAIGNLTSTERMLHSTQATLGNTENALVAIRGERNTLQRQLTSSNDRLTSTRRELGGVRTSLADAQGTINLQAGQIGVLKRCLAGVVVALDAIINEDFDTAVFTLRAVQSPCRSAFRLF